MAAPNLILAATINGKADPFALSSTAATAILTNSASSGQLKRVNSLLLSNTDTVARTCVVKYWSAASGGTGYDIGGGVFSVPANSVVEAIVGGPINIEEDRRIELTAGTANTISGIVSYDQIS